MPGKKGGTAEIQAFAPCRGEGFFCFGRVVFPVNYGILTGTISGIMKRSSVVYIPGSHSRRDYYGGKEV